MSFVDKAKAALSAFKAKKAAKKKVIYDGKLVPFDSTPMYTQSTYIGLYTSSDKQKADVAKMVAKMEAKQQEMAAKQLVALSQQVQPMVSTWVTGSTHYGFTSQPYMSATVSFGGGGYNPSHGYYDAGVNNQKMVADLEAKVAELKAELDKKKLQEEALATPGGKRVVEI
jgi:hypothetical protein